MVIKCSTVQHITVPLTAEQSEAIEPFSKLVALASENNEASMIIAQIITDMTAVGGGIVVEPEMLVTFLPQAVAQAVKNALHDAIEKGEQ